MRRILVEAARRKGRVRHGGGLARHDAATLDLPAAAPDDDVLAVDDALARLAAKVPAKAELVNLRYFAGLTLEQAATCQGESLATAKRRWAVARAWLYDALRGGESNP